MIPDRWQRVEDLYHRALECPPDRRAAFLAGACGDRETRHEVESLLAYDAPAAACLLTSTGSIPDETGTTESRQDRMRIVDPTRRDQSNGLYELLLRRLRICGWILTAALTALAAQYFWDLLRASRAGMVEELGGAAFVRFALISHGLPLAVSVCTAVWLHRSPPASVRSLRALELLLIGTVAAMILWGMAYPEWYSLLEAGEETPRSVRAFQGAYVESTSLRWFALLVGYGALIPNTWRRCAAVVSVLTASPLLLFALLSIWARPLESEVALDVFSGLAVWLGVAAALVVFTAYRIELLREEAACARKLGQYVLKDRLGAGGMGEVYLAEHVLLRRPCAVKFVRRERAGDPQHLRRFEREVRLTASLTHPNTVQVFDYGHTDDGTFYYVMEYLNGLTLDEIVRRYGPLPSERVVYLLRQVCAALREAHGVGLIHRDIKPSNVRVCERGGRHDVVKLLDFGLVLPVSPTLEDDKLTQEGTVTGTPAYMSPEQAGGSQTLDARSDIYSVGALAYFLLTGRPPFVCASPVRTLAAHLYEAPKPPTMSRADISPDVEAVVLRCLEKNRADRFPDVDTLDRTLACCCPSESWSEADAAIWWDAHASPDRILMCAPTSVA
jgi:serine/threonine-protein kinase